MAQSMLSTADNPFSPFEDFENWFAFDTFKSHHSCALLGRVVVTSEELSEADQRLAIEQAIDEILENDVEGLFIRVTETSRILGS